MKPLILSRNAALGACLLLGIALLTTRLERETREYVALSPLPESMKRAVFPLPAEFRGFLSDWAYVQGDQHFHAGTWRKILPFLRIRAILTPEETEAWSTGAWHLAFNLSDQAVDPYEKMRLRADGFNFLAEGIRLHPDVAHLYFDMGWMYHQVYKNDWAALQYFKKALSFHYDLRSFIWVGYIYHRRGMFQEEVDLWKRCLALYPNNQDVQRHYQAALDAAKNQKSKEPSQ